MVEHPSLASAAEILKVVSDPALRDLLAYWMAIHPRTVLPSRGHFDPVDVPRALPNIVLTEVERDPYRFRVRLMGTEVVRAFGRDFTGRLLDDVIPDFETSFGCLHRIEVAETGMPNYRHGHSSMAFRLDFAPIERIHLPLASDGATVDVILSMTMYIARRAPDARGDPDGAP